MKIISYKNKNLDNPQSIATELNMHPFVAKSYNRASNKYSFEKVKQILEYMDISESTLSNLRSSIRKKLNLNRKQGLYSVITNL